MNYYPCNNIGISVDGVSHKGLLKLRNEYIPIACPTDVSRVSTTVSDTLDVDGCISIGGKLRILSKRGSGTVQYGFLTNLDNNLWSVQQSSIYGLYNRIGVGQKRYCIEHQYKEVYISYMASNPSAVVIKRVNTDGTTTNIATTPNSYMYGGYIASFVNSNGHTCIAIINSSTKDSCYYYDLAIQQWTQFTLSLPSGTVGDVYSSTEENVIFCISSDGYSMYKYNFSNNTYTNITNWSTLAGNLDKVGRVNHTNWRIPIVCNGKVYHFLQCNIDTHYYNSTWQTKNTYVILDEDSNVIFVPPSFGFDETMLSVCGHDNCIYILFTQTRYVSGTTTQYKRDGKFYKFDPKTRRMYDMSIPHLVIDE